MIDVKNVSKQYGDFSAVSDVSFTIDSGEIIGLVGPNGAGKTTTMKMITGFLVPTSGSIIVDGEDVATHPLHAQTRIGYLPEHNPLYPEMAVQDYLVFIGKMRGLRGSALVSRLGFVAEACALGDVLTRPIKHLSKGYRQRVGLAQAIIHDPEILILDEPTSGLDPNQIVDIRSLITRLGEKKTVILSTHILSEVEEACSRAIIIVAGRLGRDDQLENLVGGRDVHLTIEGGSDGAVEKIRGVSGVETVATSAGGFVITPRAGADVNADLHRLAVAEGWTVSELATRKRSLEDVFRDVSREAVT